MLAKTRESYLDGRKSKRINLGPHSSPDYKTEAYFGNTIILENSLEKNMMLGRVEDEDENEQQQDKQTQSEQS